MDKMADLYYSNESKTNLISRLYALRAGLSVAANEAQLAKTEQNKINDLNSKQSNEMKAIENEIVSLKNTIRQANVQESSLLKNIEYHKNMRRSYQLDNAKIYIFHLIPIILLIIGMGYLVHLLNNTENSGIRSLYMFGSIALGIICIILFIHMFANYDSRTNRKSIRDYNTFISDDYDQIQKYKKTTKSNEKQLNVLEKEKDNKLEAIKQRYTPQIEAANDKYKMHINAGSIFCNNLDKQFCAIISRQDWKYVDYIIFCLETGRADSLKEALKLADEENRTRRLEISIGNASKSVQDSFNKKLNQLHVSISQELNNIRSSIASSISHQNNLINQRLEQITSDQAYNNALMSQVANNSANMAASCDYIAQCVYRW